MAAYYNEIDPFAATWLRELIARGLIAPGEVDERSIEDVTPDDLHGYAQCHFFAGIGGWSYAARLAGWPDDRPLWTGSCPCQPFSVAGKGEGQADKRHLWPVFFQLIRAARPAVVMGEQVAAAVGKHWFDGVCADLEGIGYAIGAAVVPACAVDAPHRRDRLWFVADAHGSAVRDEPGRLGWQGGASPRIDRHDGETTVADASHQCLYGSREAGPSRRDEHPDGSFDVAHALGPGRRQAGLPASRDTAPNGYGQGNWLSDGSQALGYANHPGWQELRQSGMGSGTSREVQERSRSSGTSRKSHWAGSKVKAGRRVEPGIRLLAHGIPARVGKLRAYGNAIVPQLAAEVIGAYLEARAET